jgi:hypothetical protein
MSYIGRGIDQIDNISTLDNLSFSGSTATFNLTQNSVAFVPVSADALQIQIDGVIQSGNYTVSGSTVTFDFTPSGSSVCNGIRHFGVGLLTTVSDSSITTAKLGADAVTTAKINDGAVTSGKIASGVIPTSRPNVAPLLMNCNMAISQRNGTTATAIDSEAYSLDRWSFREISNGSTTVQQTTTVPSGKGFANSLKVAVTGADTSIVGDNIVAIAQKLEGQDTQLLKFGTSDAQKVTISFWVRSNVTGTYSATLRHTNTSGTAYVNSLTFSISSGDTWEQKVLVFNANTSQDIRNTNTEGMRLEIMLTVGSDYTSGGGANANTWTTGNTNRASASNVNILSSTSNTFYLTGVQMEVGEYSASNLPNFQHESYGDNFLRCQRYCQQFNHDTTGGNETQVGIGWAYNSSSIYGFKDLVIPMRTQPTMSSPSGTNYYRTHNNNTAQSFNQIGFNASNTKGFWIFNAGAFSGLATDQIRTVEIVDANGYVRADAEL